MPKDQNLLIPHTFICRPAIDVASLPSVVRNRVNALKNLPFKTAQVPGCGGFLSEIGPSGDEVGESCLLQEKAMEGRGGCFEVYTNVILKFI